MPRAARTSRCGPHGHAVAEPEALPVSCDWRRDPAVRTVDVTIEPPSLADNTSDFDRLRRALAQQHGIRDVRAELPLLRGLAPRPAHGQLEGERRPRDARLGLRHLPAAAPPARLPERLRAARHGARRRRRHHLDRGLPRRLRDRPRRRQRERLQQADRLRRRRDQRASSTPSARAGCCACSCLAAGDDQRPDRRAAAKRNASSPPRSRRSRSPATRP